MNSILKGDSSGAINIVLQQGYDYTGSTIHVEFCGVLRSFAGKHAGDVIQLAYDAEETKMMPLGAWPVKISLVRNGLVTTVRCAGLNIRVTDDPTQVYTNGVITIDAKGLLYGITDLPASYTDKDVVAKIREILIRGGAVLCALFMCGLAFGASVTGTAKENIRNTDNVVTNVDLSGLVTEDGLQRQLESVGGMTEQGVRGIVTEMGSQFGKVKSVNGHEGEVVLSAGDIRMNTNENAQTVAQAIANATPSDYQSVKANAATGANHAGLANNPHGVTAAQIGAVTGEQLEPISTKVEQALAYSQATYQYNRANTNAWFEGTNYNVNAEQAEHKVKYSHEDWEDVLFTPCSLQLYEIRGGERKVVWDQRDWTVYYWNLKSQQLSNNLATATHDLSENVRTNYMKRGWAKYTAVNGLDNPDPSTLWIDTPKVQLMAEAQWEKLVEVGGAGYYTLTGNGIQLAPADAESTFLTIKDFEGNACLTFRKTSSYLVYCECGSDIVSNYMDNQGRVTFHLTTDVQPTAEFSTTLELDSFVEQDGAGCPANYEWTGSVGSWDCHFKLKPGITANACFARFKVMREGENVVEHTVPIKLNGGIVFEQGGQTLKCKPVAQNTSVGSTVNWVIAQ